MAEENKIPVKFDPASLMQGIKDKIKSEFVSLIPDEQWSGLVKKEVDGFFNDRFKSDYDRRNGIVTPSEFSLLAKHMLKEKATEMLRKELDSLKYQTTWENGIETFVTDTLSTQLKVNPTQLLTKLLEPIIAQIIQSMRNY